MDKRKIERIILLILALLNVFLLSVVLSDSAEARRSAAETVADLTAVLEENGISVADGAVQIQSAPVPCTLTRDLQREGEKLRKLLGPYDQEDTGGNIIFYRGGKGQGLVRGSGELDVLMDGGAVPLRGGRERTAKNLLRRLGVAALSAGEQQDAFCCALDGVPVYNAVLEFGFTDSFLQTISGTWLFDGVSRQTDSVGMDSISAALRFVEIVRSEGFICSRVERVEPGYLMTVTRSGEAELTPVWRIETDTGPLMIDAGTGRLT